MTTTLTATQWARENGYAYLYRADLDNHNPTRQQATGELYHSTDWHEFKEMIVLDGRSQFKDNEDAIYLVDNGSTVTVYYVAAWHPEQDHLILHPFPLSKGIRDDNGQPVDASTWSLGPRRAYHLKVRLRFTCPCGMAWADEPGHQDHAHPQP